jgi:hypothetical protein
MNRLGCKEYKFREIAPFEYLRKTSTIAHVALTIANSGTVYTRPDIKEERKEYPMEFAILMPNIPTQEDLPWLYRNKTPEDLLLELTDGSLKKIKLDEETRIYLRLSPESYQNTIDSRRKVEIIRVPIEISLREILRSQRINLKAFATHEEHKFTDLEMLVQRV